jgi:hypothetical protein
MNTRCSPGFERLLAKCSIEDIDASHDSIFGLWSDYTLAYFNVGWMQFADRNGAPPHLTSPSCLGLSVIDVCGESLAPFYSNLFASALSARMESLHPYQHRYECSSATLFREYLMTLYPLENCNGLLVVNSLVVEQEHSTRSRQPLTADCPEYQDALGVIRQCSHCRRVKNAVVENRWDWVPNWVESPPPTVSHGLCPICFEYYYPIQSDDR